MRKSLMVLALLILAGSHPAHAMFALPTFLPADRIIENLEAHLRDNPSDVEATYTLGRVHYLCFSNATAYIGTYDQRSPNKDYPNVAGDFLQGNAANALRRQRAQEMVLKDWSLETVSDVPGKRNGEFWEAVKTAEKKLFTEGFPGTLSNKELVMHAEGAAKILRRAADLAPDNGLSKLTLASFYKQYLDYASKAKPTSVPLPLQTVTKAATRAMFLAAFQGAKSEDSKLPYGGMALETGGIVSYEAGKAYLGMAPPVEQQTDDMKKTIKEIERHLAHIQRLPQGPVTPIIFSLQPNTQLADMLAPNLTAQFDLDGDGATESWPWLARTTALLVWDPDGTGRITSGRQLFGSATWWLLFTDGYRALDVLDNNRDGQLTGDELTGIAAWFDRNSDGISQPGEVVPVQEMDIVAIRTNATGTQSNMLTNPRGIRLKNGQERATYDWVTRPQNIAR